jgi:hypothetical protein
VSKTVINTQNPKPSVDGLDRGRTNHAIDAWFRPATDKNADGCALDVRITTAHYASYSVVQYTK